MKEHYEIFVFTSDRDLDEKKSLPGILTNSWQEYLPGVKAYYASSGKMNWQNIRKLIASVRPDFLYLNSLFSRYFTIYPLLMKRFSGLTANIVLAPRGMLKSSALQ